MDASAEPVERFQRLLLAADAEEGGDSRLAPLAVLLEDMLAPHQAERPTMAQAHARMAGCLAVLTS